jgi:hypothetical protein
MAEAGFEAITETVLPVTSGGRQAGSIIAFGKRSEKDVTFFNTTFRLR